MLIPMEKGLSILLKGRLLDLTRPRIMGILNITPDSFFEGSRVQSTDAAVSRVASMLKEGADIIDLGGFSSRPGALLPSEAEELNRLLPIVKELTNQFPEVTFSIDTMRAAVAERLLEMGVSMINDISGGDFDKNMIPFVAKNSVPYICMHMRGIPENMQQFAIYDDVVKEVFIWALNRKRKLIDFGVKDIIFDPGFGFSKNIEQNFKILRDLSAFRILECPILVGLSRKSMIYKTLKVNPEQALNGTTAVHMIALMNGANILRVHDVREAKEVVEIYLKSISVSD